MSDHSAQSGEIVGGTYAGTVQYGIYCSTYTRLELGIMDMCARTSITRECATWLRCWGARCLLIALIRTHRPWVLL